VKSRRVICICIFLSVIFPIVTKFTITPTRLKSADNLYKLVESLKKGLVLICFDFGPSSKAENEAQAEVLIEHLLRKAIPFAVFTQVAIGEPFLRNIPEKVIKRLKNEDSTKKIVYGRDWVNLGYRPGTNLLIQSIAKSKDLGQFFVKDAYGTNIDNLKVFDSVKTLKDISLVAQITGLIGTFPQFIQFMQTKDYIPPLIHGCTSITIPEAYIYLDSGQIKGLLEGLSGAAWYSEVLKDHNPKREVDSALVTNTALGISQLMVLLLILVGNIQGFLHMNRKEKI
jgi:hypothetical protein